MSVIQLLAATATVVCASVAVGQDALGTGNAVETGHGCGEGSQAGHQFTTCHLAGFKRRDQVFLVFEPPDLRNPLIGDFPLVRCQAAMMPKRSP